ncbi:MAG: hypothetical protein Q9168_004675 [Polycauliona sp. 1 TL-2023]
MTAAEIPISLAQDLVKSKKRKRAEEVPSKKQRKGAKLLGLNALPWNEVSFPDNLEDAEGFFGLEEISDVEIAKDEKTGQVEYRHLKSSGAALQDHVVSEESVWNGCEDSDPGDGAASPPKQAKPKSEKPPPKSGITKSKQKGPVTTQEALLEVNRFQSLANTLEQDEDGEEIVQRARAIG